MLCFVEAEAATTESGRPTRAQGAGVTRRCVHRQLTPATLHRGYSAPCTHLDCAPRGHAVHAALPPGEQRTSRLNHAQHVGAR